MCFIFIYRFQEVRRRQTDMNKLGMVAPDKMPSPLREVPGKTRTAQKVVQTKSLPVGGAAIVSRYLIINSFITIENDSSEWLVKCFGVVGVGVRIGMT